MSADFWAGYLSGAAGIIIGNPLDLIKTRLQAGPAAAPASRSATPEAINWRNAGNYVRGATAPILGYGALNAILFVSYNRTLSLLGEGDYSNPRSLARVFWAGAVGGFATFVVSAPTELVKCRAQVYDSMPRGRGGAVSGGEGGSSSSSGGGGKVSSWAVARETWRAEGLKGFYHGGVVTGVRDAVGYAFYFWSYELSKRLINSPEDTQRQAALKVLLCGGIAGIVTWASIFPLDVIKTRVQTQQAWTASPATVAAATANLHHHHRSPPSSGERASLLPRQAPSSTTLPPPTRRMGAWEITKHSYRTEGLAVFFRGLGICSVRAFIVNAVQWAVYEWVMQLMREKSSEKGAAALEIGHSSVAA